MNRRLLMSFVLVVSIVLQFAPSSVNAQQEAQANKSLKAAQFDRSRYSIPYKKFVLDNGLTLLVHEDDVVILQPGSVIPGSEDYAASRIKRNTEIICDSLEPHPCLSSSRQLVNGCASVTTFA